MRFASSLRSSARVPLLQAIKMAVATVAASLIASAIVPGQVPVFAAVAALLVVAPSVNQSIGKAIERSIGVIIGVVVAYGVGLVFGKSSWIALLAVVVAIFLAWLLRLAPSSANQVPISAMLVLSIGANTPGYAAARIGETIIGAVIAVIVNLTIVPPVLLAPAQRAVVDLAVELANTLDRLANALGTPQSATELEELLLKARLLRPMEKKAADAVVAAEESLSFNPRGARLRATLRSDAALQTRLGLVTNRVIVMTRAVRDHYDDTLGEEPTVRAIIDECRRAAHDLRLTVQAPGASANDGTAVEPALTAPLVITAPHPEHWILLGSLVEDLRRVHEEIAAATDGAETVP